MRNMEELIAEAVFYETGYSNPNGYQEALNALWTNASGELEQKLLELESLDYKTAMDRLFEIRNHTTIDETAFGKHMVKRLRELYEILSIDDFAKRSYELWTNLPESIKEDETFFILNYAGDSLSYGDELQCRKLFEKLLNYYS